MSIFPRSKTYLSFLKIPSGILLGIGVIALLGQLYAFFHPGYANMVIEPDPVLGWKLAPGIQFVHTGDHWYANERSVRHKINSYGFVGPEWSVEKPSGTVRVALMGDSFVEALQVPREQNAAGLLEKELNRLGISGQMPERRYEVFNFGVSNFSVGQYLLLWEESAAKFNPDYVFIFVAGMQMKRTTENKNDGGVPLSRPSFELINGKMFRHRVENDPHVLENFNNKIKERGGRSVKRNQQVWLTDWIKGGDMSRFVKNLIPQQIRLSLKQLAGDGNTIKPLSAVLKEKLEGKTANVTETRKENPLQSLELGEDVLKTNLMVIEELDQAVRRSGGKLVVVDASLYFWFAGANEILPQRVQAFCDEKRIPYIPLYKDLLETDRHNMWARFPHSHHFNEHGHVIFARNLLQWLKTENK